MGALQRYDPLGTVLGIRTTTSRGQVARATFECLCFQLHRQLESIEQCASLRAERLRVVAGGQKNPFWLQLKADVTGRVVEVPTNEEITLLGVAILAGVGAGIYRDVKDAFSQIAFPLVTYEPNQKAHAHYLSLYERVFQKIAPSLQPVYEEIHRL